MDIQKWASVLAPTFTPMGPAAVLIQGLHDGLVKSGMDTNVAWGPAMLSGTGMELTGFLASKMTIKAIKQGDGQSFIGAALGIVGYVIFAVTGIQNVPNSDLFASFVGMSTIAYFAYGIYEWMNTKDEKGLKLATQTLRIKDAERQSEIEYQERMAKIEREKAEAEHKARLDAIRLAKISAGNSGQTSSRPVDKNGQFDPAKLAWVKAYYEDPAHKGHSCEKMVAAPGCPFTSRQTALKYRTEASK